MKRKSSPDRLRWELSPEAEFRIRSRQVEARLDSTTFTFSRPFYDLLLLFSEPRSMEDALRRAGGSVTRSRLRDALRPFVRAGFLNPEVEEDRRSLVERLNRAVWKGPRFERRLATCLRSGGVCIIRDAFKPAFAEQVAEELETGAQWAPRQDFRAFFGYKVHDLDTSGGFPERLSELKALFEAPATKRLIESWTGANCRGAPELRAQLHLPGDYATPHRDQGRNRTVSFIWYLTRHWDSTWGGQLYWCSSGHFLMPTFNTLLLFKTSIRPFHLVCPVTPTATGKRITVNGYWTADRDPRVARRDARVRAARQLHQDDWCFGKPLEAISRNAFVIR